jgi:diadenylate cyclase
VSLEQIPIGMPSWRDLLEILIVAAVLYKVLKFLAGTRALQILFGVLALAVIYVAAFLLKLSMITYILGVIFTYGAFAALVVFQPELRYALARLGQTRPFTVFSGRAASVVAEQVSEAVDRLSQSATGAIIAVEREVALEEYLDSGTRLQASLSADLVATIFSPYSPLHDGAIVVRGDQIIGAGCILPLTQHTPPSKALGTRHRAALGLSEETDAIVFVVSEETSTISVARLGSLEQGLTPERVRELLATRAPR